MHTHREISSQISSLPSRVSRADSRFSSLRAQQRRTCGTSTVDLNQHFCVDLQPAMTLNTRHWMSENTGGHMYSPRGLLVACVWYVRLNSFRPPVLERHSLLTRPCPTQHCWTAQMPPAYPQFTRLSKGTLQRRSISSTRSTKTLLPRSRTTMNSEHRCNFYSSD